MEVFYAILVNLVLAAVVVVLEGLTLDVFWNAPYAILRFGAETGEGVVLLRRRESAYVGEKRLLANSQSKGKLRVPSLPKLDVTVKWAQLLKLDEYKLITERQEKPPTVHQWYGGFGLWSSLLVVVTIGWALFGWTSLFFVEHPWAWLTPVAFGLFAASVLLGIELRAHLKSRMRGLVVVRHKGGLDLVPLAYGVKATASPLHDGTSMGPTALEPSVRRDKHAVLVHFPFTPGMDGQLSRSVPYEQSEALTVVCLGPGDAGSATVKKHG